MLDLKSKEEYNEIPVYYCKHCLSLLIKDIPHLDNSEFCEDCGATSIGICSIDEWEEMYKERHGGTRYLDINY